MESTLGAKYHIHVVGFSMVWLISQILTNEFVLSVIFGISLTKPVFGFLTRSDINQAVQLQKLARA